ncbi:hypothetical protein BJY01DRAFT_98220 [Aspergillus pseudoustus]|uniref:Alcohol acetyltransferase n=1 Tax=Aspergillus pseudoustus TaxID=1810923 RepID=A0ABR4J1W7_9EURO
MASTDYTWKPTAPDTGTGTWARPIDEAEQFYTSLAKAYQGTGRTFFAMTGFISFSVPVDGEESLDDTEERVIHALRKAWVRLRYDHPTIASRVRYDVEEKRCFKVYEMLRDVDERERWLVETFKVVDEGVSGTEWCNNDPPVPDLPTLFLIKSPRPPVSPTKSDDDDNGRFHADLILRSHHDIIDGMGALLLFSNLFAHAARAYTEADKYKLPKFGDEYTRLSPPLRVAAQIPSDLHPEHSARLREIRAFNAALRADVEIATLPFKSDQKGPGKHQRAALTLPLAQTDRLLNACREAGLSITHAYHAAIALVVRDMQERRNENERIVRYISYSLINERARCGESYGSSAHPAAVYHSVSGRALAIDLVVSAAVGTGAGTGALAEDLEVKRGEYMETAKRVRDFYLEIRSDKEHIFLVPSYWAMATPPHPSDGKTPSVPARNESPSVSISSMGVLDKVIEHGHGVFSLEDPWVTGEELGTGLGLFLGTWKGRLALSAAYNEAWHDEDGVMAFLESCNRVVFEGLGIAS